MKQFKLNTRGLALASSLDGNILQKLVVMQGTLYLIRGTGKTIVEGGRVYYYGRRLSSRSRAQYLLNNTIGREKSFPIYFVFFRAGGWHWTALIYDRHFYISTQQKGYPKGSVSSIIYQHLTPLCKHTLFAQYPFCFLNQNLYDRHFYEYIK